MIPPAWMFVHALSRKSMCQGKQIALHARLLSVLPLLPVLRIEVVNVPL